MRVYIAGKLNAKAVVYIRNASHMMYYAEAVRARHHAVYVPCLDILMGLKFGNYEYEDYFDNNQAWLEVSDVLFVCPRWETSKGTKREIRRAKKLGIPVVYSLEELDALQESILAKSTKN